MNIQPSHDDINIILSPFVYKVEHAYVKSEKSIEYSFNYVGDMLKPSPKDIETLMTYLQEKHQYVDKRTWFVFNENNIVQTSDEQVNQLIIDKLTYKYEYTIGNSGDTSNLTQTWYMKDDISDTDKCSVVLIFKINEVINSIYGLLLNGAIVKTNLNMSQTREQRMIKVNDLTRKSYANQQAIETEWKSSFTNATLQDKISFLKANINHIKTFVTTTGKSLDQFSITHDIQVMNEEPEHYNLFCSFNKTSNKITLIAPKSPISNNLKQIRCYQRIYTDIYADDTNFLGHQKGVTSFNMISKYVYELLKNDDKINLDDSKISDVILCLMMFITEKHHRFRLIQKNRNVKDLSNIKYTKLETSTEKGMFSKLRHMGRSLIEKNEIGKCKGKHFNNIHIRITFLQEKYTQDDVLYNNEMLKKLHTLNSSEVPRIHYIAQYLKHILMFCDNMQKRDIPIVELKYNGLTLEHGGAKIKQKKIVIQ